MRGAHSGSKRQPGKRLELVVDKKRSDASIGILAVDERRIAAAVIEDRAELLAVLLIKSVNTRLKIVLTELTLKLAWPPA